MKLEEVKEKRILLSALNWGMGHVSRCIGLIYQLQAQGNEVIVACDTAQQQVFESYFPEIQSVFHAGYPFDFSGNGTFASDLFANRKKLFPRFAKEQKEIEVMIADHQIDLVISDHRYGFFSKKTPSVFVTHQLCLPLKWYQFPAQFFHKKLMGNFQQIWCMDTPDHMLAGKLSDPIPQISIENIGWFSRFTPKAEVQTIYDLLFVVSGPEPYAEQFFKEIARFSRAQTGEMVCIAPQFYLSDEIPSNLQVVLAGDWKNNDAYFYQSGTIVSRAGYSTLMDLKVLGKKAILVPTPGQEEQVYLAKLHADSEAWTFKENLQQL